MLTRLRQRWLDTPRRSRVRLVVLVLLALAAVGHQLVLWDWYLEDAAISFAYARHLAAGEGLVPYVGGERVEGYSNPLWVLLLTPWYWVGISGFISSKIMSAALSVATIFLVYGIAREARPDARDEVPLFAAGIAAASSQFAIWNAGGLENGLFNTLMALGIWLTLRELRSAGWPWAALVFFGLAITRPEGILYAAFGGMWYAVLILRDGRPFRLILGWLLTFFLPFGAYHALRYWYFAWEWPNTYYAKLGHRSAKAYTWNARCWKYMRQWSHELWHGYFLPLYLLGLLGTRTWRRWLALVALLLLGVVLLYPGTQALRDAADWWPRWHEPRWWVQLRVITLVSLASLVPVVAVGRKGWRALVMCWGMGCITLYFSWWSTGDWSKGFRWFSLLVVPSSVLLATGMGEVADTIQRLRSAEWRTWRITGWVSMAALAALVLPPNIHHTAWFRARPETGPYKVKKRVDYMNAVRERLHLEREVNMDVDMGATIYWALPDTEIVDVAGLLDIPIAMHHFEKPFMREYIFEERNPEFVHSHGGWARSSRIQTHSEWERYFEIPGYLQSKRTLHGGNWVRKDLFARPTWEGSPGRTVRFADGITLEGWEAPAGIAAPGRHLYVEVALSSRERREGEGFRVMLFLADASGHLATWSLPPGYDWYQVHEWTEEEVVFGRFSLPLPKHLPEGTYDLGFAVVGPTGEVLHPTFYPPEGVTHGVADARLARGEVRWPDAVEVVGTEALAREAQAHVDASLDASAAGRCEQGEASWRLARRTHTRHARWLGKREPAVREALAACWVTASETVDTLVDRVDLLEAARLQVHDHPDLRRARRPVVAALVADGHAAREVGDWESAYRAYSDVLRIEPTRSWARRWAEEARDHRLGLDDETRASEERAREERREAARQRHEVLDDEPPEGPEEGP